MVEYLSFGIVTQIIQVTFERIAPYIKGLVVTHRFAPKFSRYRLSLAGIQHKISTR